MQSTLSRLYATQHWFCTGLDMISSSHSNSRSFKKEKSLNNRHGAKTGMVRSEADTAVANGIVMPHSSPHTVTPARRGAGVGLLSPLVLRRTQYAVRSSSQTQEEEERCQRITNFNPTQEISLHQRCITAVRLSTDFNDPYIGELLPQKACRSKLSCDLLLLYTLSIMHNTFYSRFCNLLYS